MIKLKVSTQLLSPIGDDENVLPDFSYLNHRESFEANVNSSLDISLRNQHGTLIRRIVAIFNRFCSISLQLNNFVRKYDEEILFEEDFGNEINTEASFLNLVH